MVLALKIFGTGSWHSKVAQHEDPGSGLLLAWEELMVNRVVAFCFLLADREGQ